MYVFFAPSEGGAWTCRPFAALKDMAYSTRSWSVSDSRWGIWMEGLSVDIWNLGVMGAPRWVVSDVDLCVG